MRSRLWIMLLVAASLAAAGLARAAEKSPCPAVVSQTADDMEDVIDLFLLSDWAHAELIVDRLVQNRDDLIRVMENSGLPPFAVYELGYLVYRLRDSVAERTSASRAAFAANQISALMVEVRSLYAHSIPVEADWLDYLAREVVLASLAPRGGDLATQRTAQLETVWQGLKPRVVQKKGGEEVAAKMDEITARLGGSLSPSQRMEGGNRVLELVDKIEALFH